MRPPPWPRPAGSRQRYHHRTFRRKWLHRLQRRSENPSTHRSQNPDPDPGETARNGSTAGGIGTEASDRTFFAASIGPAESRLDEL